VFFEASAGENLMRFVSGLAAVVCLCAGAAGAAAAPVPGFITFTVVGFADPNGKVPVINGVPGSGVTNLAVPFPVYYLNHGSNYNVTIGSNTTPKFQGNCVTEYILYGTVSGKAKKISSAKTKPYACGKETYWAYDWNTPTIPAYIGPASVVAEVSFGTTVVKTTTHFYIQ
jgi:hypothetical protein